MNGPNLPGAPNKIVDIKPFENIGDLQLVNGYGNDGFRVSGDRYIGSILLCPRRVIPWQPPEHADDLSLDHIIPHLGKIPPPLFILGTGGAPKAPLITLVET